LLLGFLKVNPAYIACLVQSKDFMKQNKMAEVREHLSINPSASPPEIVATLTKKKVAITIGVASNYKSVIKSGAKRKSKKAKKPAAATNTAALAPGGPSSNGAGKHGLDPDVIELLKAGRTLGWKKVQSIVELMVGS
jgi:hypothetical protein